MSAVKPLKQLFSFFTVIPIGGDGSLDAVARRLSLTPIVGAFYGVVTGILLAGAEIILPPLPSAAIMLLAINALNGFLHMDGLMDFGDGLTALGGRENRLKAMKDTSVGAGGASLALITTLASLALYGSVPQRYVFPSAFAVEVMCVNSMIACAFLGRPHSSGLGALFVENVGWKTLTASSALSIALVALTLLASAQFLWLTEFYDVLSLTPLLLLLSVAAGFLVALLSNRVFGCVTGDVLGACHELARIPLLVVVFLA